jgi:trehalose 6-phosphate synthase
VRESDSAAWSSSYYSALVKAGDRRLGKTSQSSPKMNEALDRLKAAVKKNGAPSRRAAHA